MSLLKQTVSRCKNTKCRKHRVLRRVLCASFVSLALAAVSVAVLAKKELIFAGQPDSYLYPCRGAYVTEKTGVIDWKRFAGDNIDFCYIRTTSGTAFSDGRAGYNLLNAEKAGIRTGCVHDFDFAADGKMQADNFISLAGIKKGRLIPALDVRMDIWERLRYHDADTILHKIREFIERTKEKLGCGAVLLCDERSYKLLGLDRTNALVWTDKGFDDYIRSERIISIYSDKGRSPALADSKCCFALMTAGKGISEKMFFDKYTVL